MSKFVYLFSEGNASMRELLGGKGANLAEMTKLGLPVPQGFTISTEACTQYYEDGKQINENIKKEIFENIVKLEEIAGKKFGDKENPLLVSVRSGARASMPGMMDTILNLGLNDVAVEGTTFVAGNYTLKVTYNNDTNIVATKEISAVTYSASYKSSRIYQSGDRVYFEMVFNSVGYKPEDFAIFHYSREIKMTGTYANGLCTLVGDITVNGNKATLKVGTTEVSENAYLQFSDFSYITAKIKDLYIE